ncbi:hypothetical protein [Komagataeibacter phage phiKX1]|nr:hypothetical protein [Komagataeibacter sp. FNDCR1]BCZ76052.1 hypothetical protein [Komagataeibacter phage phiKX1]BCZ76125.1 hypothetical protein [Komagataeibacter phage phiKX2]
MARPRKVQGEGSNATPVRLMRDHGYIETRFNRGRYHWAAGEVITNPDEIAHLRERGAELEPVECQEPSHPQP